AAIEIDVAEVAAVGDAEAAGLLPHRQQLQHVRQARLAETPLDRHQRNSSMARPETSGQSQITFSSSRNSGSAGCPLPLCAIAGAATRPSSSLRAKFTVSGMPTTSAACTSRCTVAMISATLATARDAR